jgi:hypothetical protein
MSLRCRGVSAQAHAFSTLDGLSKRINENVILSHQLGQLVGVALIDGF